METIPYEDQFHVQERTWFRYREDGEILKGWNKTGQIRASGNLLHARRLLEDAEGVEIEEVIRYSVCDYACIPVGNMYDRPYAFMNKAGVQFPNLRGNCFESPEEAFDLLRKIRSFFQSINRVVKRKTDLRSIQSQLEHVWMTTELKTALNSSNTLKKRIEEKQKRSDLVDFFDAPL